MPSEEISCRAMHAEKLTILIMNYPSEELINDLIASIQRRFPLGSPLPRSVCLASAKGDDWSVQKIRDILNYRLWDEISYKNFQDCGPDELKSYLSKEAFLYYLPGLMVSILGSLRTMPLSRLREVSTMMLLPYDSEYRDLWEHFGDGLFNDWGTPYFSPSGWEFLEKLSYVHASLTPDQRACVARYIDMVEFCEVRNPDQEFLELLKRFIDFWRK